MLPSLPDSSQKSMQHSTSKTQESYAKHPVETIHATKEMTLLALGCSS